MFEICQFSLHLHFLSQSIFLIQADNRDPAVKRITARSHLSGVEQLTQNLDKAHIFNMDETPVYIDMVSSTTMDFIGSKNVDGMTTGHEKCRFTVAINTCAAGNMLQRLEKYS